VNQLTIAEAAYLAALPKAPENYNPFRAKDRAVERRNWVVDRMVENGYIRAADGDAAKASALEVKVRPVGNYLFASEFSPRRFAAISWTCSALRSSTRVGFRCAPPLIRSCRRLPAKSCMRASSSSIRRAASAVR
jgi:membrane peptidoglycan carboxypeptidase